MEKSYYQNLAKERRFKRKFTKLMGYFVSAVIGGLLLAGSVELVENAWNNYIDNQNTMLCKSAKQSGNEDYLNKCSWYYQTGDIKYLR